MPGYNAQAMASPLVHSSGNGMLITAADVVNSYAGTSRGDAWGIIRLLWLTAATLPQPT